MIVIIPARAGSKRIKKKNIKLFKGKPIIYWIIKELKKNKRIKSIVVTSDDKKILNLCKKYSVSETIKRSKNLSSDKIPFQKVIKDTIKKLKIKNKNRQKILVVYPCSFFLKNFYIFKADNILRKNPKSFIMSVGSYSHPVQRAYKIKKNRLEFFDKKYELSRTQDLQKSYFDAGQFYLGFANTWLTKKVHLNSVGMIMPKERTIDIDNLEDWKFAEKLSKIIK